MPRPSSSAALKCQGSRGPGTVNLFHQHVKLADTSTAARGMWFCAVDISGTSRNSDDGHLYTELPTKLHVYLFTYYAFTHPSKSIFSPSYLSISPYLLIYPSIFTIFSWLPISSPCGHKIGHQLMASHSDTNLFCEKGGRTNSRFEMHALM